MRFPESFDTVRKTFSLLGASDFGLKRLQAGILAVHICGRIHIWLWTSRGRVLFHPGLNLSLIGQHFSLLVLLQTNHLFDFCF